MQLDRRQLRHPDQRRQVLADAEVDLAGVRPADRDPGRLHPVGPVLGAALLEEGGVAVVDALGEAAQGQRPPGQVGDDRRRDLGVVVDHLALGEAGLRVEDLVEVGELQLTAVDLDGAVGRQLGARLRSATSTSPPACASEARGLRLRVRRLGVRFVLALGATSARFGFSCARSEPRTAAMLSSSAAIRSGALVASGSSRGRGDDLLALGLPLDQRQQLLAVLVAVAGRGRTRPRASRSASRPSRPPCAATFGLRLRQHVLELGRRRRPRRRSASWSSSGRRREARIAARCSRLRRTKRAIAALPEDSIASASSE